MVTVLPLAAHSLPAVVSGDFTVQSLCVEGGRFSRSFGELNGSVVTVLPAVVNDDYTVTVQSLSSHYV